MMHCVPNRSNLRVFFCEQLFENENPKKLLIEKSSDLGILNIIKKAQVCEQNKYHQELLLDHLCNAYDLARNYTFDPIISLACLFHDIGKVITKQYDVNKQDFTFHKHEYVGYLIVSKWLKRWGFSDQENSRISLSIRNHQYRIFDDTTDKAILKWLKSIGQQTWEDIRIIRLIDRMANEQTCYKPILYKKYIEVDKRVEALGSTIW